MTQINILQGTRTATDGIIHTYTHPTHHQSHTRRKKCSRTFEQSHSGTNTTVLFSKIDVWTQTLTTVRNPVWRLEGAYRPSSTFKYSIQQKRGFKPTQIVGAQVPAWGSGRFCPSSVPVCPPLRVSVPGGVIACKGHATPGHHTDPSCLNNT